MSKFTKLFSGLFGTKDSSSSKLNDKQIEVADKYYSDYKEVPYVSPNRNLDDWYKRVDMFPNMLVQPEMMTRNSDGLLPGHIYQIYWIDKYHSERRIPEYFEFKYGIDFYEGKKLLESKNLIKDWSLTKSGEAIIDKYQSVIAKHQNEHLEKYNVDKKAEIKRYREEAANARKAGIEPYQTEEQKMGYLDQMEGIGFYKTKDFDKGEKYLLMAFDKGYATPAGTDYLAKIYRKSKDYQSEISALERGIEIQKANFNKETKNGKNLVHDNQKIYFEQSLAKNTERLEKAKALLSKQVK